MSLRPSEVREVQVGSVVIGGRRPLVLIAGPCVIESETACFETARALKELARRLDLSLIFKSSYDKANRSSVDAFRGPGLTRGLEILEWIRDDLKLPVLSDVHDCDDAVPAARVLDALQIPAFLCRQTDLVLAAARTGRVINIKKGQFLAPWDIEQIIRKVRSAGNDNILLTERGTSFGYHNLVADMRSLAIMRSTGFPVVFDVTHSLQLPGGLGCSSGGQREFIAILARAAVAVGIDALFMEVHSHPDAALCDGPNSQALDKLEPLLRQLKEIDRLVKQGQGSP